MPTSAQDAIKVAVIARHGNNRNIGRGFVNGFGLKRGAIASSVGHDSHNITVVGADDDDMARAVNRSSRWRAASSSSEGAVPGRAGAAARRPDERALRVGRTTRSTAARRGASRSASPSPEPFLQVAFLPLPVIPHLKITDMGLFDVDRFALIEG